MKTKVRYKYNIIEKNGRKGPWTGIFKTEEAKDRWYNEYGKEWESKGYKLVLKKIEVECIKNKTK